MGSVPIYNQKVEVTMYWKYITDLWYASGCPVKGDFTFEVVQRGAMIIDSRKRR